MYENGKFYRVEDEGACIIDGMLFCRSCKRWYPIKNRILIMLPDNLIIKEQQGFSREFKNPFAADMNNCMKAESGSCMAGKAEDILKVNEMEKRDEQAYIYHTFGFDLHDMTERDHFMRLLNVEHEDLIVELGCGTGRITEDFAGRVDSYIAIDFSRKSLELIKDNVSKEILMIQGDVCRTPVKSAVARYVISAQVFEHIPGDREQQAFVMELKRILSSDGHAALTIYNYSIEKKLQKNFKKQGFHAGKIYYKYFDRKEILKFFRENFKLIELRGINCYLPKISKFKNCFFRKIIENILSRSFLNAYLGNVWLLFIKKASR